MILQRVNRSDPEKVFIVCSNGYSTASLTNGQTVMWDLGDANGVSVTRSSGARRAHAFAGIASETIAAGAYGLIQVYGYHAAVIVDSNTSADIFTGCALYMDTSGFHLEGPFYASGTTEELSLNTVGAPAAVALEAYGSVGTTGTIKAIIHAL
jgi:hypothetical protein